MSAPACSGILEALSEADFLREAELAALKAPLRLVWGARDRLLPEGTLDFFRRGPPRAGGGALGKAGGPPPPPAPPAPAPRPPPPPPGGPAGPKTGRGRPPPSCLPPGETSARDW